MSEIQKRACDWVDNYQAETYLKDKKKLAEEEAKKTPPATEGEGSDEEAKPTGDVFEGPETDESDDAVAMT